MDFKAKEGFVISMNEQTILQVVLHIITIVISLGMIVLSIYLLILTIKLARRGIVVLEQVIEEKRSVKNE